MKYPVSILILLLIFFHPTNVVGGIIMPPCSSPLSGTYTVNPSVATSATNYTNLSTFSADLNNCGVSGHITVNVAPGVYNEQIHLHNISGTSSSSDIVIQTDPLTNGQAIISYSTSGNSDFVIQIDTVSHLTIKDIAIIATGTSGGAVSIAKGHNDFITFENDSLYCISTTSSCVNSYLSGPISNITFKNNTVYGGQSGMRFYGSSSNPASNILIDSNQIMGWNRYGLYATYMHNSHFNNNYFSVNSSGTLTAFITVFCNYSEIFHNKIEISGRVVTGLKSDNCYYTDVIANEIYTTSTQDNTGLFIEDSFGLSSNPVTVANNMVGVQGGSPTVGINTIDGKYNNIVHNSVRVYAGSNSIGLRVHLFSANAHFVYFNNNIVNHAGGHALYGSNLNGADSLDFNNYYSSGSNIAYFNGSIATMSAWQSATGNDGNSINTAPSFNGPKELHVTDSILNNAGTPWPSVTTDIDQEARSPYSPDIGADEFELSDCYTPTAFTLNHVTGVNATFSWQLDSGYSVEIEHGISGYTAGTGNKAGPILSNSYTITNLASFTTYDVYIRALCDTLGKSSWFGPVVVTTNCDSTMHGSYTINPSLAPAPRNYTSFNSLANTLNTCGVSGPVIINIAGGVYNEQFYLHNIPGSGPSNPIIIQGDTNGARVRLEFATATHPNLGYVIRLDTVSYLTIKDITILNKGAYAGVEMYAGYNDHITFINDSLITPDLSSLTSSCFEARNYTRGPITNITLKNNVFLGGRESVVFQGAYGYNGNANITIDSNIVEGWYTGGIFVGHYNQTSVTHNSLSNTVAGQHQSRPLYLSGCDTGNVSANEINFNGHSSINLEVSNSSGINVIRNKIVSYTQNDNLGIAYRNSTGDSSNRALVANNMVTVSSASRYAYGFNVGHNDDVDIANNSVNVLSGTTSYALNIISAFGTKSNINYLNNSFVNLAGGYAVHAPFSGVGGTSDYNNFFTTGNKLGKTATNTYNTLSQWRIFSGSDSNSISAPANYYSNIDLHSKSKYLNGKATPLPYVTHDFDNNPRSAIAPDIGADEFDACNYSDSLHIDSLGLYTAVLHWKPGTMNSNITLINLSNPDTSWYTVTTDSLSFTGLTPNTSYMASIYDSCINVGMVSDTAFINFTTLPCPVVDANFGYSNNFHEVSFNSSSSLGVDSIYWDFGDGNNSDNTSPPHIYQDTGLYQVWVYVFNSDCGDADSLLQSVRVCDTVQANFNMQSNYLNVSFNSTSVQADSIYWDFGDGGPGSNALAPNHTYAFHGSYNVKLYAFNACLETDTSSQILKVCDSVSANFIFTTNLLSINLTDSSINADSLYWDLGNGKIDTSSSLSIGYDTAGVYNVELTAYNACGDSSVTNYWIEVCDTSKADFTYTIDSVTLTAVYVSFNGSNSSNAHSFIWDFGDGTKDSSSLMPSHSYPITAGSNYTINLVVINQCNEADSASIVLIGLEQSEQTPDPDIQIYPNPATDKLSLKWNPQVFQPDYIEIYNSIGKLVFRKNDISNIQFEGTILINHLSPGFYSISIGNEEIVHQQNLVIEH